MKTRMQPIGNIWSKFPRTVRDVASAAANRCASRWRARKPNWTRPSSRPSRTADPHRAQLRDHGIESPRRGRRGKNLEGRLFLRAFHEGGQVNIEISDDGAGLDFDKIATKPSRRV